MIWSMFRSGVGDDEIVLRMHTDITEVKDAIVRMEAHRAAASHDMVDMAVNSMVIRAIQRKGRVLEEAMGAERTLVTSRGIVLNPETQMPYTEPDHATRLEALRAVGSLIRDTRPKGPGIVVQNNNNSQTNVIDGGRSFEARRRAAAARRGVTDAAAVAVEAAPEVGDEEIEEEDAGIIDGDVDVEDSDTDTPIAGVSLDDPDDAGEEDEDGDDE